jgi:arylsulfatase A-like enzyme
MPTFIVIILDDSSAFEYTEALCPRIASFKKKSTVFPNFYTHPVCTLSRVGFMYGSYGKKIGTIDEDPNFFIPSPLTYYPSYVAGVSYPSLASVLTANGYSTCIVGKWHAGIDPKYPASPNTHPYAMAPITRGYQQFRAGTAHNIADSGVDYFNWTRLDSTSAGFTAANSTTYAPSAQVFEAIDWLGDTSGNADRFLHVALHLPHAPFHAPPSGFLSGYTGGLATGRDQYMAMLRAADTAVGFILDAAPNTSNVFIWSDNGSPDVVAPAGINPEHLKRTSFKDGTNVLAAFQQKQGPGGVDISVKAGTSPRLMHSLDIGATILSIAGIPIPAQWDSLPFGRSAVLTERQSGVEKDRSCRTGAYLLRQLTSPSSVFTEELYHLPSDPKETTNVISNPKHAGPLAFLRARLAAAAI